MPKMTVRSTFSLDPETAQSLDRLARRWGTSKSEVLRRAVGAAVAAEEMDGTSEALAALEALQQRLGLDERKAARWIEELREERRSARP
ncbi:MAG TPA: ribbon-helix-helix protein, CopG family [Longimicrobiales bacterium]|nr:ribbon-helix-helix protein, CopG family [Longimicrobiales bacterium]